MRVAISSDWHVMSSKHVSHTTNLEYLLEFLQWGEKECDHIILAGDIFELIKDSWSNIIAEQHKIVGIINDGVKQGSITYLPGNHDWEMKVRWNLPEEYHIPGTDILVMHGHQFDNNQSGIRGRLSHYVPVVTGFIEDLGWRKCTEHLMAMGRALGFKSKYDPRSVGAQSVFYDEAHAHIAQKPGINRLVHGHTHRPYIGDGSIMNCGGNTVGFSDYMIIENGKPTLHSMSEGFEL